MSLASHATHAWAGEIVGAASLRELQGRQEADAEARCAGFDANIRELVGKAEELVLDAIKQLDARAAQLNSCLQSGELAGAAAAVAVRRQLTENTDLHHRLLHLEAELELSLEQELERLAAQLGCTGAVITTGSAPLQRCGSSSSLVADAEAYSVWGSRRDVVRALCEERRNMVVSQCECANEALEVLLDELTTDDD